MPGRAVWRPAPAPGRRPTASRTTRSLRAAVSWGVTVTRWAATVPAAQVGDVHEDLVRADVDADHMAGLGVETEAPGRSSGAGPRALALGAELHHPVLAQELEQHVVGGRPGDPDQRGEFGRGELLVLAQYAQCGSRVEPAQQRRVAAQRPLLIHSTP